MWYWFDDCGDDYIFYELIVSIITVTVLFVYLCIYLFLASRHEFSLIFFSNIYLLFNSFVKKKISLYILVVLFFSIMSVELRKQNNWFYIHYAVFCVVLYSISFLAFMIVFYTAFFIAFPFMVYCYEMWVNSTFRANWVSLMFEQNVINTA